MGAVMRISPDSEKAHARARAHTHTHTHTPWHTGQALMHLSARKTSGDAPLALLLAFSLSLQ